jgi:accessory gene regulator B
MYKKIADNLSNSLVSSGAISGSDVRVYSYAAELLLSSITGLVICVGIGILFGSPLGSVIFLVIYCPLRQFSGGYHAANHIACAAIFCLLFLGNTLVAHNVIAKITDSEGMLLILLIVAGLSVVVINLFSPVEDRNKPLDQNEVVKFKKKTRVLSIAAFILIIILVKLNFLEASYYACSAVLILSILLVMGIISNLRGEKNEKVVCKICSVDGSDTVNACYGISK